MDNKIVEVFIPGPAGRMEAKYYKNPKFDAILESARKELNFEKRKAIYQSAQKMLWEDSGTLIPYTVSKLICAKIAHYRVIKLICPKIAFSYCFCNKKLHSRTFFVCQKRRFLHPKREIETCFERESSCGAFWDLEQKT